MERDFPFLGLTGGDGKSETEFEFMETSPVRGLRGETSTRVGMSCTLSQSTVFKATLIYMLYDRKGIRD